MKSILFISILLSMGCVGCNNTHTERQQAAKDSFTNQEVEVKATTCNIQFIARCEDGSIWELIVDGEKDANNQTKVIYKNCLFDPIYVVPKKPLPLLEKVDK
jgi:hypothetical protein